MPATDVEPLDEALETGNRRKQMAKKGEHGASDPIIEALEDVKQRLNATNELLRRLNTRMTEGWRTSIESGRDGGALPELEGSRFPPSTHPAAVGDDESILHGLAKPHDLEIPMDRLITLRNDRYPDSRPRYWGIVNFDLHSAKPRLFVFDVVSQTTDSYLCAHGRGSEGPSDDGFANVFSNKKGSNATSLGIYRCAETYNGKNGYSLR